MEKNTAIFEIRTHLGLKQRQMMAFLNIEQSNYSMIEAGKRGRKLNDRIIRLAEINLKVNPDYLRYRVGHMFVSDYPLYSQRINVVCNTLHITIDNLLADIKDLAKRERLKRVLRNDDVPDYELLKIAFGKHAGVNYDFLIDATGSPVITPGSPDKQFYKTFEDDDYLSVVMEAMKAYKSLAAEKSTVVERLQAENEELKKTIDLLNQKINEHDRE